MIRQFGLIFLLLIFSFSLIAQEKEDTVVKPSIEHHVGLELLGKLRFYSFYYEREHIFKNPMHHLGVGFGANLTRDGGNTANIGNSTYLYYALGRKNQLKTSISFGVRSNLRAIFGSLEDIHPSNHPDKFAYYPSLSLGYLRKQKRLSYGVNLLYQWIFTTRVDYLGNKKISFYQYPILSFTIHYNFLKK